ncbi:MAG: N-acetylmuramoyl-L-alanine amidase-like domain-containing protein [Gemmatimonadota bacterium]
MDDAAVSMGENPAGGEPVGREPTGEKPADRAFHIIGKPQRKVDGQGRVSGRTRFTDDISLPGMLHGKILRSPHPHARIVSVEVGEALALPGVHGVVTGKDMPVTFGIIPWTPDEYPLALDRVRYVGDGVAAVAAEDEDTALAALKRIQVEYEPLRVFLDPHEALAHTPQHPDHLEDGGGPAPETLCDPYIHEPRRAGGNGNLTKEVGLEFGGVEDGFRQAEVVVEGEYFFHGSTHAPMEPHCAIGLWEPDPGQPLPAGKLTVWSSTQVPHYLHRELARVLGLDPARVRVVQPPVGGGFGGKSEPFDLEFAVAALAIQTGRPVKILYTREELFYSHRGRHPFHMSYRTGATRDGKLTAVDARTVLDGGAYASFGLVTTYYSGQLLAAPYVMPAYRFRSARAYTNKPACGPKRGHGSVQPRFALEVQLDKLAQQLEMDPMELRRQNAMGSDTRTVNELRVTSNGFLECLAAVEKASGWKERWRKLPQGRGLGVAGSCYISGTNYPIYPNEMPQSAIQIQVDRSGRVAVFSGGSEIGQGVDSMVAYVAAEELGVPLEFVRVYAGDTDFTPVDLGAYSSRVTFMLGNACLDAAGKLRRKVQVAVGEAWECPPEEVLLAGGRAHWLQDTSRQMPIREAFVLAESRFGTLGEVGWYNTPKDVHGDYRGGTIGASPAYSFTAHVAEVDVDLDTGYVKVEKLWVAHDCGRALNPVLVEGQMEGSAYMGFGEAMMEEQAFKSSEEGRAGLHHGPSLLDYRIPTTLDTPELESFIVESLDPEGPYGAKEAGEGPLHPSIPAIANAIHDAVGIRMDALPFTPPRVWRELRAARERGELGKPAAPVASVFMLLAATVLTACGSAQGNTADLDGGEPGTTPVEQVAASSTQPPAHVTDPQGIPATDDAEREEDWVIAEERLRWAWAEGLDTLPMGDVMARLGTTFVGATYLPQTLEIPGPERLVINLRALDCVTFVENILVLSQLVVSGSRENLLDNREELRRQYRSLLTRVRYRDGTLDGYPSRLHYFSEWLSDGEKKGLLEVVTAQLGGVVDSAPLHFMTSHPEAYRQLADSRVLEVIRQVEARLSRQDRIYIPEDHVARVASGIRNGDIIATRSTLDGLDIAHTGLALWVEGELHLLHAPLVGSSVEVSKLPLAQRLQGIRAQDGIFVARAMDPRDDSPAGAGAESVLD